MTKQEREIISLKKQVATLKRFVAATAAYFNALARVLNENEWR